MATSLDESLLTKLYSSIQIGPSSATESTETLLILLKKDFTQWHLYWNHQGYHNHLAHHLFALYEMGAPPEQLQQAFDSHSRIQRAAFLSPEPINTSNWKDHVGDENYYNGYLKFFADEVMRNGIETTMRSFIFSSEVNAPGQKGSSVNMLSRFFGGLMHSLIQFAYGAEFNVLGTMIQGLAWAAVHNDELAVLFNEDFFEPTEDATRTHSFTIVARMLGDPELAPRLEAIDFLDETGAQLSIFLALKANAVRKHTRAWRAGVSNESQLRERVKELAYLATLFYGVSGWSTDGTFRADFFFMHFVTSSRLLLPLARILDREAQNVFLEAWFTFMMAYWVKRGRPGLPLGDFFQHRLPGLTFEVPSQATEGQVLWSKVVPRILPHRDEHFLKIVLALFHHSNLYGQDGPGCFGGGALASSDVVDSSLFSKVASLTLKHFGVIDASKRGTWARKCFL